MSDSKICAVIQLHHDFVRAQTPIWQSLFEDTTPPELLIAEMEEDGLFAAAKKWADKDVKFQRMTAAQVARFGDHFDESQVEQHVGDAKKVVIQDLRDNHRAVCA